MKGQQAVMSAVRLEAGAGKDQEATGRSFIENLSWWGFSAALVGIFVGDP